MGESAWPCSERSGLFSAIGNVKTKRENECRLLFVLYNRNLDVEKSKWIYRMEGAILFERIAPSILY